MTIEHDFPADPQSRELRVASDAVRRGVTTLARRLRALRADHGLSPSKLDVLGRLYRAGREVTAVELAREAGLQPQSLTRIIAELDERGAVARRADPDDGRQVLIVLTAAGHEVLRQDALLQNAWLADAMASRLSRTERGLVALALEVLERLGSSSHESGS